MIQHPQSKNISLSQGTWAFRGSRGQIIPQTSPRDLTHPHSLIFCTEISPVPKATVTTDTTIEHWATPDRLSWPSSSIQILQGCCQDTNGAWASPLTRRLHDAILSCWNSFRLTLKRICRQAKTNVYFRHQTRFSAESAPTVLSI